MATNLDGRRKVNRLSDMVAGFIDGYSNSSGQHLCVSGRGRMPARKVIDRISDKLQELLCPGHCGPGPSAPGFTNRLTRLLASLEDSLVEQVFRAARFEFGDTYTIRQCREFAEDRVNTLMLTGLPGLIPVLEQDLVAAFENDPAARGYHDIVSGPGFFAISNYRVAHEMQRVGIPLLPRMLSESARSKTGIDIHPHASIGHGFAIDHGTGVVIGETTTIGNFAQLFQGVTLGATKFAKNADGELERGPQHKRHPTLEDHVKVFANASIFGGDTVIGRNTWIGANVRLYHSVPAEMLVRMDRSNVRVEPRTRLGSCTLAQRQSQHGWRRTDSERMKAYDYLDRYLESVQAGEGGAHTGNVDELDWPPRRGPSAL